MTEEKTLKSGDFVISKLDGKSRKIRYLRDLDRQLTLVCYVGQLRSVYVEKENNGFEELKKEELILGE